MFTDKELMVEYASLRRYCLKLTRKAEAADDLCQTTTMKALLHREQFTTGTKLLAWLATIAFNQFRSDYRKRKEVVGLGEDVASREWGSYVDNAALNKLDLKDTLRALSRDQHGTLVLECAQGASYQHLADKYHIPLGTVKSLMFRTRKRLVPQPN